MKETPHKKLNKPSKLHQNTLFYITDDIPVYGGIACFYTENLLSQTSVYVKLVSLINDNQRVTLASLFQSI